MRMAAWEAEAAVIGFTFQLGEFGLGFTARAIGDEDRDLPGWREDGLSLVPKLGPFEVHVSGPT